MGEHIIHADYLVIGGGVAGISAAEIIRNNDTSGVIVALVDEEEVFYSKILLGPYIRGEMQRDAIFLRKQKTYAKHRIDLILGDSAEIIDVNKREVQTIMGRIIAYRKLLISCGVSPKRMHKENENAERVLYLSNLKDADSMRKIIYDGMRSENKDVLVQGDGFAAVEMALAALTFGYKPHIFLNCEKFWDKYLDYDGTEFIKTQMERSGIVFYSDCQIRSIRPDEEKNEVGIIDTKGQEYSFNWVGVEPEYVPNIEIFRASGLAIKKGILTNEFMESNTPHVWAAGSVAECSNPVMDTQQTYDAWVASYMQGVVAGFNMSRKHEGIPKKVFDIVPSFSINFFGMHITFLGDYKAWHDYQSIVRFSSDHSTYERLFLEGGVLKGAIIINQFADKPALAGLIEQRIDLSAAIERLQNPRFNVASLIQK